MGKKLYLPDATWRPATSCWLSFLLMCKKKIIITPDLLSQRKNVLEMLFFLKEKEPTPSQDTIIHYQVIHNNPAMIVSSMYKQANLKYLHLDNIPQSKNAVILNIVMAGCYRPNYHRHSDNQCSIASTTLFKCRNVWYRYIQVTFQTFCLFLLAGTNPEKILPWPYTTLASWQANYLYIPVDGASSKNPCPFFLFIFIWQAFIF